MWNLPQQKKEISTQIYADVSPRLQSGGINAWKVYPYFINSFSSSNPIWPHHGALSQT